MSKPPTPDAYGELIEPTTLKIQRLLPGPIERVWAYLTQSELRRQWLASGDMDMEVGAPFELVWRNDQLTKLGNRPQGFDEEHRMESRIVACEPPHKLAFTWQRGAEVAFELEPRGSKVLLTVVHRRLPDRATMLKVAAGWHAHLDVWVARATGTEPEPFWDHWVRLKDAYDGRIPA
jgi:uncharacterized protein YndB with AHSA1/START domain